MYILSKVILFTLGIFAYKTITSRKPGLILTYLGLVGLCIVVTFQASLLTMANVSHIEKASTCVKQTLLSTHFDRSKMLKQITKGDLLDATSACNTPSAKSTLIFKALHSSD